jgi:hypothetical protein
MDRYASRLSGALTRYATDLDIALAGEIASLTVENGDNPGARRSGGPDVRPVLPSSGLAEVERYVARYAVYPRRIRRTRADVYHVLDHSYSHMLLGWHRHPSVVTVHDLR